MKQAFKSFTLAAIMTTCLAACSGNKKGGSADSTKVDSSTSTSVTDTTIKTDTAKRDTATELVVDTPKRKIDTASKTVTKKTVVKKVTLKKP